MIDFSPVYTTGLIVNCKTLEDSIALFEEVKSAFAGYTSNLNSYAPYFLSELHKEHRDAVGYRLYIMGTTLIVRRDNINWYKERSQYKDCVFVEYTKAQIAPLDDVFDEVDILSLLEGGETHA